MHAEGDIAVDGAAAHGDEPDPSVCLRRKLTDAILGRGGNELSSALEDLLDTEDLAACMSMWFSRADRQAFAGAKQQKALLARDIAAIDALLGDQVDAIIHHADFKRLEATWRGVDLVVGEAGEDEKIRVRIFDVTWQELSRDFDRAAEFDQSALFAKVYSEEYGMPGGVPYGLLICDYPVRHRVSAASVSGFDDVDTLTGIAQVAAAAFSPCVLGAAPELFGVGSLADLSYAQRLDSSFRLAEYHRWQKLRSLEDSRFIGIAVPRFLVRDRYRDDPARQDGFRYSEGSSNLNSWLWGNAAFAFGVVAIRAFREWGWFGDICSPKGGVMDMLATSDFSTREAVAYRRPLEVELTDKKQKALEDLGFMSLSPCHFTRSASFLSAPSLHSPPAGNDTVGEANARLSSMLQYVMCVSRFAHYVKVMARDRVGAYTTVQDLERYLDSWLREYTIGNSDAGPELKARYPLSGARLEVREMPGRPGSMACVLHLQPHFQFDQVISNFQLRTEIPSVRAR